MTFKRTIYTSVACILLVALPACAAPRPQVVEKPVTVVVEKAVAREAEPSQYATDAGSQVGGGEVSSADERMIIRTGNLSLVVSDTNVALDKIKAIVTDLKGYLVTSNAWHEGEQIRANLSLRVPAESFDATLEQIKAVANKVDKEEISGQDVTEEYSDLNARLRNLEATEVELRELLTQVRERTGKAEDIMAVYRELTNVRGQIEQLKGRMQYLERLTAMATINVELLPDALTKPIVIAGWRPGVTVSNALRNLVKTLQFLVDAVIWIILYVAPILIIIALPLVILLALLRRWRRHKSA